MVDDLNRKDTNQPMRSAFILVLTNLFVQRVVERPFVLHRLQDLLGEFGADLEAGAVAFERLHALQDGLSVPIVTVVCRDAFAGCGVFVGVGNVTDWERSSESEYATNL